MIRFGTVRSRMFIDQIFRLLQIKFTKFKLLKLSEGSPAKDSIESRLLNTIEFKYLGYDKLPNLHRKEKWDYTDYGDDPELETPSLNGTFINEQIGDSVTVPAHHKLILQLDISNQLAGTPTDFVFSTFLFKYELEIATKFQVSIWLLIIRVLTWFLKGSLV